MGKKSGGVAELVEDQTDIDTEVEVEVEAEIEQEASASNVDEEIVSTPEAVDENSPEFAKLRKEWMERVCRLNKACAETERQYSEVKSEAILLKKELEGKVNELRRVITRGPSRQPELPFDNEPGQADVENPDQAEATIDHYEELLQRPIAEALALTSKQKDKLASIDVETVGDFEKLRAGTKDYPGGLIDVKGIGQATIDKWEDEIVEWFDRNQKPKQSA